MREANITFTLNNVTDGKIYLHNANCVKHFQLNKIKSFSRMNVAFNKKANNIGVYM